MHKRKIGDGKQPTTFDSEYIATICSAAVRFTKSLLAYGAENNWTDVVNSEGRSWNAGDIRREWKYISKKAVSHAGKRLKPVDMPSEPQSPSAAPTSKPYFFYNPSHEHRDAKLNYIARKAAAAVLAATGACDQHAYVLAMLLRMLLPPGIPINICAMHDNSKDEDFSHTFVVLGHIQKESPHLTTERAISAYKMNDDLLVVDAWPTTGGVVRMRNFWLRDLPERTSYLARTLRVDCTYLSDGVDHLLKRVEKQKRLNEQLSHEQVEFTSESLFDTPEEILKKQKEVHKHIKSIKSLEGYRDGPGMWGAESVVKSGEYHEPPDTENMMQKILASYPLLRKLLDDVDEKLEEKKVPTRKGSGLPPKF